MITLSYKPRSILYSIRLMILTATNNSLWMQLKHHGNTKSKFLRQEGEASKANPPCFASLVIKGNFFLFAVGPAKS